MSEGKKSLRIKCTSIDDDNALNNYKLTAENTFYIRFCSVLEGILPLTKQERNVLAEILYMNYMFRDKIEDDAHRWAYILSNKCRKDMVDKLNLSYSSFSNHLSNFRKANILKNDRVIDNLVIYPVDNAFSLTFNFEIIK